MLVVEALLRAWRVGDPKWRLRLRLVPLAAPLLLVPLFFLLAPWRASAWFATSRALFAGERWNLLRVGPAGAGDLALLLAAGLGAALFLRDALPPLIDRLREGPDDEAAAWLPPAALQELVERHARRLSIPPPAVRVVRSRWPVFFAEGRRQPELVLSPAGLEALDARELDAAVAHELVHVRHGDPAWGYALIAARAANFFNPALQWAARAVVDEIERRADHGVVEAGLGGADALASAIVKLFDRSHPAPGSGTALDRVARRVRQVGIERRRERLVSVLPAAPLAFGWLRLALASGGLAALLYFVV
ncbi:MAG: peptidase BlaR1 [Acidobacteria bacterium]|nr:peptidase BlaR1 [Acidobacteriota bacterium]